MRFIVDRNDELGFSGWVVDQQAPQEPVLLDVRLGDGADLRVVAGRYRDDLAAADIGHGGYGFAVSGLELRGRAVESVVAHGSSGAVASYEAVAEGVLEPTAVDEAEGEPLKKYDVVNALARVVGDNRYLEITTPSTGYTYHRTNGFRSRSRLMYGCPPQFDDGADVTFRTTSMPSLDALRAVTSASSEDPYDVIFVDPEHSYWSGATDLLGALEAVKPGGAVVVHDCLPTDPQLLLPGPRGYCGETFAAFLDVANSPYVAGACVVAVDYGVGILFAPGGTVRDVPQHRPSLEAWADWHRSRNDVQTTHAFFVSRLVELTTVWSAREFRAWAAQA